MRPAKGRLAQRDDSIPGTDVSHKLQKIISDIKTTGNVNLTRLTVLKKWFETRNRIASFGIFIANQASRRAHDRTEEANELFREAREILADVNVLEPNIPRTRATTLHARLNAFQNERRESRWASVRLIHDRSMFLVESGLGLYLWHGDSPTEGYRLAANYCEHYDPRHGNGLNGPSVDRIKEIARFVLAMETHEKERER
jgi:hypothetical protein